MLCSECGKKTAVVRVRRTVNGKTVEELLCRDCAAKYRHTGESFYTDSPLADFLSSFFEPLSMQQAFEQERICPVCGMSYRQFTETGKVGCGHCYQVFARELAPILRNIHKQDCHLGKIPLQAGANLRRQREVADLRRQLEEAVSQEKYEEAVMLRDKIKDIENKDDLPGEN